MRRLTARSAECRQPAAPCGAPDLAAMRAAAFHRRDMAVLPLAELPEIERLLIIQICERLYGRRKS
jgi:hypothetical protein